MSRRRKNEDENRVAEFDTEAHIEAGGDWGNLDRTKIPDDIRKGFRHVHAYGDAKIQRRLDEGWEREERYTSRLPGHTLLRLPVEGPKGGRARDNWIERRAALNEGTVEPEALAERLSAETGGEVIVSKRHADELESMKE